MGARGSAARWQLAGWWQYTHVGGVLAEIGCVQQYACIREVQMWLWGSQQGTKMQSASMQLMQVMLVLEPGICSVA